MTVEAGGSLRPRAKVTDADRPQRLAKARLIADAWKLAGIDAVAVTEADWAMGAADLREIVKDLPVLAANLTCGGESPFPASAIVERGGWKVGIVGLTTGTVDGCEVGRAHSDGP